MTRILMLPHRTYPSDHAMLETVYTRLLPQRGHQVVWMMHRGPEAPDTNVAQWNGTPVYLLEPRAGRARITDVPIRIASAVKAASHVLAHEAIDIVQVRNDLTDACAAIELRRRHRLKFVYQLSFPLGESRRWDTRERKLHAVYTRARVSAAVRLRSWVMKQADLVLAISDAMRTALIADGIPAHRVVSFPLGADTSVDPATLDRTKERRRLQLDDVPTIIYVGTLERLRRLGFLLDVIERVRASRPNVRLVIVGGGADTGDRENLEAEVSRRGLDDVVRFIGRVPRAEVASYLVAADVSVSPIPPLPFYTVSSPTKVVESLAMAIPVVANREIPDQANLLAASGGGLVVPYEASAFAAALDQLISDPAAAREAGRRGREHILATRSYERLAHEIEAHYALLLGRSVAA